MTVDPDARPADAGVLAGLVTECLEGLQNRTRQIEVRIAAETRLVEAEARERLARKARRLARMLAVAGVVVAAMFAAGLGWYANDRIVRSADEGRRRAEAIQQVEDALAEAETLDHESRDVNADMAVRDTSVRKAQRACQRAEAFLTATSRPPEEFQDRLSQVQSRVTESEREIRTALATDNVLSRELVRSNLKLGLSLVGTDRGDEALEALRFVVKKDPNSAVAHAAIGGILVQKKDFEAARTSFLAATAIDPNLVSAQVGLAQSELALGHTEAAEKAFVAANKSAPSAATHAGLGQIYLKRWEAAKAVAEFRLAVQAEPNNPEHRVELVKALGVSNDHVGALREAQAGAKAIPTSTALNQLVGELASKVGDTAATLESYRKVLAADPKNNAARHALGKALADAGDDSAIEELKLAAEASPASGEIRADLGDALLRFGRFRTAASTLREAADKLPEDNPRREVCRDSARNRSGPPWPRVPEVLAGTVTPQSAAAWADFAEICRRTKRYAAAAHSSNPRQRGREVRVLSGNLRTQRLRSWRRRERSDRRSEAELRKEASSPSRVRQSGPRSGPRLAQERSGDGEALRCRTREVASAVRREVAALLSTGLSAVVAGFSLRLTGVQDILKRIAG